MLGRELKPRRQGGEQKPGLVAAKGVHVHMGVMVTLDFLPQKEGWVSPIGHV